MCDRDQKLRDVVELTSLLLDDRLDDAGHARLEELLFGDPEACELYLNTTTLHAHLTRELGGERPLGFQPEGVPAPVRHQPEPARSAAAVRSPRRGVWQIARYAAAACVMLVVGAVSVLAVRPLVAEPNNACATLVEARGVEWAECSVPRQAGARLEPQTIGINRGTVVIRFDSGAVATMTGPGELLIESRKSAELKSGCVLLRAEKEAVGFNVKTAASDFVDLGTEFGVAVNPDSSSEVHVFEGVVIVRPRANDVVVPVLGNEAGRIESDRGDVVAIEANPARFTGVTTASAASRPTGPAVTRTQGPLPPDARVIFIGDRATDLETHLLLINQAMAKVYPDGERPRLYNAGISMPLTFTEPDVRKHVLAFQPTHAVIEFGPEIAASPYRRPIDRFESEIRRLIDRLETEGIEPIVATGFKLGQRQAQCQGILDDYNRVLRKLAAERNLRLADVDAHFRSLEKFKLSLVAPNGAVPTFSGSREVASVLLAAMGFTGTKVDPTLELKLLPGAITHWKYRLKAADQVLTSSQVAGLAAQEGFKDLILPQPDDKFCSRVPDATHLHGYRDRARGFATHLHKGRDKLVEAIGTVESSEDIPAFLNTGGEIRTVWLNGRKVYENHHRKEYGTHAGAERIPVSLLAGPNQVIVEAEGSFFVSVTDNYDWPVQ